MTFRVISNKKVDMTDDEYKEYLQICRSYDRQFFKGEELFKDLFETNEDGMIVFIKRLGSKQFSFEVMFFLSNLMQNQWLRLMATKLNNFLVVADKKLNEKLTEMDKKIEELNKKN